MKGHRFPCKALRTQRDADCTCGWVRVRERQRELFTRTLTAEEIDYLIGPTGEGVEYKDGELGCDESTTE